MSEWTRERHEAATPDLPDALAEIERGWAAAEEMDRRLEALDREIEFAASTLRCRMTGEGQARAEATLSALTKAHRILRGGQ